MRGLLPLAINRQKAGNGEFLENVWLKLKRMKNGRGALRFLIKSCLIFYFLQKDFEFRGGPFIDCIQA